MSTSRSNEIKVGVISILAVAILIIGIALGKGLVVSNTYQLKFRFPNSGGITVNSPVFVNGVKRGMVTTVANDNNAVLVSAALEDISDIYDDAAARIMILEITGGRKIEITPGISGKLMPVNTEIPGTTPPDLAEMVAMVGDVADNTKELIRNLDTLTGFAKDIIYRENAMQEINNTMAQLKDILNSLHYQMTDDNSELMTALAQVSDLSIKLNKSFDKYEPQLDATIGQARSALSNGDSLINDLRGTLNNATIAIGHLNEITARLNNGEGAVGKLLMDTTLANNLDSAIINLKNFVTTVSQHGVNVNVRLGTRP